MEAAADPVNDRRRAAWRRLNNLEPVRPQVWVNEICWPEMALGDELTERCQGPLARDLERQLRRGLYQWRHLPGDMVVDPWVRIPPAISDSGIGITVEDERIPQGVGHVQSHHYRAQISEMADIDRIRDPLVTHDQEASAARRAAVEEAIGDLAPVVLGGPLNLTFTPWDRLVELCDIQSLLMDLILRPDFVHAAVERMASAMLRRFEQYEELGLLAWADGNHRVGTGGMGICSDLPAPGFDPSRVRAIDCWGGAMAQIFSEVSPEMHEEFALRYECRWLERVGLAYYGCCEPLHHKIGLVQRLVPNLRKISVSPMADIAVAAEAIGRRQVLSLKPNPALLADTDFSLERARQELVGNLRSAGPCNVEIILKDISTVRREPQRLWQWTAMAVEVAQEAAGW